MSKKTESIEDIANRGLSNTVQLALHEDALKNQRAEIRQISCPHEALNVSVHSDGYVGNSTCCNCGKLITNKNNSGYTRKFSAKRIYRLFVKD